MRFFVDILLFAYACADRDGNTSLFCAAELGHSRIVALCIERHADVNVKNDVRALFHVFYVY